MTMSKGNTQSNRGSKWRKWDLHLHSLYTHLENHYTNVSEDDFIKKIKQEKIEVVGLTNYFNFTSDDFELKKKLEKEGIVVFLNLELRLTYTNKEDDNCDIHIIFDPELEEEKIKTFLTNISITIDGASKKAIQMSSKEDFEKGVIEFPELLKQLEDESLEINGKYLIGFLSRGKGNGRTSSVYSKIAKKTHFLIHSSDKESNLTVDREFWLKKDKPLLQSSDAHKIDSVGKKFTWIKADKTFDGLSQILYEPKERIAIQPIEPQEVSPSYRIDKIIYSVEGELKILPINPYLNSVIGVRASGKSTLLKNIASKIDYKEYQNKSNNEKFFKIEDFKVIWSDGEEDSGNDNNKTILYIPQNFLSGLVHDSDISKSKLEHFIKELFERNSTFKSKLTIWESANQQIDKKIYDLVSNLFEFDTKLNKLRDSIKKEGLASDVEKNIEKIEEDINNVKKESKLEESVLNDYKTNKGNRSKYTLSLDETKRDIESLKYLLNAGLINLDLVSDLELSKQLEQKITKNLTAKHDDVIDFIKKEIRDLETKVKDLDKKIKDLDKKIKPIELKLKKGSLIKELAEKLGKEKNRLTQIKKLNTEEKDLSMRTINTKENIFKLFLQRENIIDSIIKDFKNFGEKFEFIKLKIDKQFRHDDFIEFCKKINFHNKSQFKANKAKYKKAFEFLDKNSINENDVSIVIKDLFTSIFNNELPLVSGSEKKTFLLQLLNNWFDLNYKDSVRSKETDTKLLDMSDGQKMNSLLELLFSFDDYSFPILIDQPEDDLDVTAITKLVTKFIVGKKKHRQIILVSHNANLVIGSDSENVIIAQKNIKRRKIVGFSYQNGSIEDKDIRSNIINILEGGAEAFKKRGRKLGIIKKK